MSSNGNVELNIKSNDIDLNLKSNNIELNLKHNNILEKEIQEINKNLKKFLNIYEFFMKKHKLI